jgi:hypothetical protein
MQFKDIALILAGHGSTLLRSVSTSSLSFGGLNA